MLRAACYLELVDDRSGCASRDGVIICSPPRRCLPRAAAVSRDPCHSVIVGSVPVSSFLFTALRPFPDQQIIGTLSKLGRTPSGPSPGGTPLPSGTTRCPPTASELSVPSRLPCRWRRPRWRHARRRRPPSAGTPPPGRRSCCGYATGFGASRRPAPDRSSPRRRPGPECPVGFSPRAGRKRWRTIFVIHH
jgi:hypothetical protein